MDLLIERLELYQLMSYIFFEKLSKEDKIDALIEVINELKEHD